MDDIITLDYGSGGEKTSELIESLLLPTFENPALAALGDGAVLPGPDTPGSSGGAALSGFVGSDGAALPDSGGPGIPNNPGSSGRLVFSTDSFVVSPWQFPGGDIGALSVCGTVNDLCMAGGIPRYLSLSFILEEGFPVESLRRITASIAAEAKKAGVIIATGDTKVVERGRGDGIYINTAGIGFLRTPGLGKDKIQEGDVILLSGSAGCHGAAVMMARAGLAAEDGQGTGALRSDCALLTDLSAAALEAGTVRLLRDPTRGGIATTLNEFVENTPLSIELEEAAIPVDAPVAAACELLGLDPLYCACEGRLLAAVAPEDADAVLSALRSLPGGEKAAAIGRVTRRYPGKVTLKTRLGGHRLLVKLTGQQLPRIC